ncbi:MAG: response regulator [Chloroflexi bacterium]|nr:MAG: response regulator [Chloroflexota bacterium]
MNHPSPLKILLIEDTPADARLIATLLHRYSGLLSFDLTHHTTLAAGADYLRQHPTDAILLDLSLPDSQGLDTFTAIRQLVPNTPIIILTGTNDEALAIQSVHSGAQDYLLKGRIDKNRLAHAISYAVERQRLWRELEQKARTLEASQARYHALVEHAQEGIGVLQQGQLVFANPALAQFLDYTIDELLALNTDALKNLIHPEDRDFVLRNYWNKFVTRPRQLQFEARYLTKTGHTCWLNIKASPFEHSNQPATLITALNVTQHHNTEDRLVKERNLLRTIIDNLPDDVFVKDTAGRFVSVNLATMQRLGAKNLIEIIGKTESDFLPPRQAAQSQAGEQALFATGQPIINLEEQTLDRQTHSQCWLLTTKVPLRDTQGQITGLVGIRRDITDRRQAEEALKKEHALLAQRVDERTSELRDANKKLTHALRVKDEFLASMSHELRTPLNAILGMSEILSDNIYGTLNENQHNSVNIIQESGRHLLNLINDILDVSKIEANHLSLELVPVAVDDVCQASLRFVKQAAQKKNISVSLEYNQNDLILLADERRLKQILVNLLSNAVKFTPENGQIGLTVEADAAHKIINFTVWDTGIGIAPEDQGRLFQPFVQLDSRLAREYEGTGLGLALVRLLADLHGAKVSVNSQVGQGSRFSVAMPWRKTEAPPPDEPPPAADSSATGMPATGPDPDRSLILLAEDNAANVEVMSSYLTAKGYRVVTASDGAETIDYARKLRPNLILMDIHMPDIDGLEATRQIRNNPNLASVPIIALTALAMPGDRERCLAAGADDYLTKPVSLTGLAQTIESHLRQTEAAS